MANSSIVTTLKKNVRDAFCKDADIDSLIDSPHYSGDELKDTHIFLYNKNPNTITETITFISLMVDIAYQTKNKAFVTPVLTVIIYSHINHMDMNFGTQKQEYNRNDYLSMLIDEKLSGSSEYGGYGKLLLVSNVEGVATEDFLYRKLVFETVDINDSICDRW